MPNYQYTCEDCRDTFERVTKIDDRDHQCCRRCGTKLKRDIAFTGLVWAPTAGGMR